MSAPALVRDATALAQTGASPTLAELLAAEPLSMAAIGQAAQMDDPAAAALLRAAGRHVGYATAGLVTIFIPAAVFLSTGIRERKMWCCPRCGSGCTSMRGRRRREGWLWGRASWGGTTALSVRRICLSCDGGGVRGVRWRWGNHGRTIGRKAGISMTFGGGGGGAPGAGGRDRARRRWLVDGHGAIPLLAMTAPRMVSPFGVLRMTASVDE